MARSGKTLSHSPNGWLAVMQRERRSYLALMSSNSTDSARRKRTRDFVFDTGQRYAIAFNACRRREASVLDPCPVYQNQLAIPNIKLSLEPPWEYVFPCNLIDRKLFPAEKATILRCVF